MAISARGWSGAGNENPQETICKVVLSYIFIYALGENFERMFMKLESSIKLGGAASTTENRIQSRLDALEKQIA